MRRSIIRDPEDTLCRAIGLLLHNQVHQPVEGLDTRFVAANSEELGSVNIPGANVGQGAISFIFELHSSWQTRHGTGADELPVTGLNAGLFVGAYHIIVRPQRYSMEQSEIQIEHTRRFLSEEGISWKKPAPMHPRLDSVTVEITPNGLDANGNNNTAKHCLAGDVRVTQTRKRQPQFDGKFAGQGLDFHNALRGEKSAVARTWVDPPGRPNVRERSVFSTWRRFDAICPGARRSAHSQCL
jgi:hypothetical protein